MKKQRFTILLFLFILVGMMGIKKLSYASENAEDAVLWALSIANDNSHGYSMSNRWGNPDYDCSSFIISAYKKAGYNVAAATYTGNMKKVFTQNGFTWIPMSSISSVNDLKRGDILLNHVYHTELYIGNGQNVAAHANYDGVSGDSSGKEICVGAYYSKSSSGWSWDGVLRPKVVTEKPKNPSVSKSQVWYDIGDTINLYACADYATNYYMSMWKDDTKIISQGVDGGHFSMPSSRYGLGHYKAYFSCSNSCGTVDTSFIEFSVVDKPGYSDVRVSKSRYNMNDTVSISVTTSCAKGQVIGIDKIGTGRVKTDSSGTTYTIPAKDLGLGNFSAYFSVYNGSGSVDTNRVDFSIDYKGDTYSDLGDRFYAYIENQKTGLFITNQVGNVAGETAVGGKNQIWEFTRLSNGAYKIRSVLDDSYLDVYGPFDTDSTNVYTWGTYTGGTNQQFYIYEQYEAYYFRPAHSTSKMLDMDLGGNHNLAIWAEGEDWAPQEFNINKLDFKGYLPENLGETFEAYIQHKKTGLLLTNQVTERNVCGEKVKGFDEQIWEFTRLTNGAYKIKNKKDNSYLAVYGTYDADNTNVYTREKYTGGTSQQFYIYKMYNAYYFRPVHSNTRMLDMAATDDHNLALWGAGENWAPQEFDIMKLSGKKCTISYDANGGTNAPKNQTKNAGMPLSLSWDIPIKEYRVFLDANGGEVSSTSIARSCCFGGWMSKIDGEVLYQPGDLYDKDSDIMLYASWVEPLYNSLEDAVRNGYTFEGWYTEKNGGKRITVDDAVSGNNTLYAHWKEDTEDKEEKDTPIFKVSNAQVSMDKEVDVYISIENNPGIIGATLLVDYDSKKLELISCEDLGILNDYQFSSISKKPFSMNWEDARATENNMSNGKIAKLSFKLLENLGDSGTEIKLSIDTAYDVNIEDVAFKTVNGTISNATYTPGDINDDGKINSKDSILLRRYILGSDANINEDAADVNRDGVINSKDSIILRRYILGADVVLK